MKTNVTSLHPALPLLREAVEQQLGCAIKSQQSVYDLSDALQGQINEDTIRRLWGLRKGYGSIQRATLDILCRYIGICDWEHFVEKTAISASCESELGAQLPQISADQLAVGQEVELSWLPDRKCRIVFLGNAQWRVELVENSTTLQTGDCFCCRTFVMGQMAYLDSLTRNGVVLGCYRIGIQHGVNCVLHAHADHKGTKNI